ncbi:MAG: glycosyltransferase family 1 protein [Patescibacteria group bacterium]|nr:glycosyltransferase family 1 protein [Patescibacteria group bacterium]
MAIIGLEASRANKQHKTGTEWYAWHLLQSFKKIKTEQRFVVYYKDNLSGDLLLAPDNFYFQKLSWPFKKLWTHLRLGAELFRRPPDKFFASNAVPLLSRGEIIATIHDLGFCKNPELYHFLEKIYQRLSHILAIKKAKKIIAVSESTKKDIIQYFPQAKNKVRVIHLGWQEGIFAPLSQEEKKKFIDDHDYPDNYLLYIGRLETKKNIQKLILAYKKSSRRWPLILAGRPGNFGFDKIQKLIQDPQLKDDIILTGYVSQAKYPKLMACASAFVFPSKFEGFGLPLLEAMACSTPIVCSQIPALKEIAGQAALFFDPDDIDDIKNKLEIIFDSPERRQNLVEKGRERIKDFSWDKTARETLDYILE